MDPRTLTSDDLIRHTAFLERLVRGLVGDATRAEDAVQEAWLAALERPPRDGRNPRGWLGTVSRRMALRALRGDRRRRERERRVARTEATDGDYDRVLALEWHQRIAATVLALDEPYRRLVVLRFYEDRTLRETAREMGTSVSTAWRQLDRALALLRERLDRSPGEPPGAWRAALLPLLAARHSAEAATAAISPPTTALLTGGLVMATKGLPVLVTAAAMGLSFAVGWHLRPVLAPPLAAVPPSPPTTTSPPVLRGAGESPSPVTTAENAPEPTADTVGEALTAATWLERMEEADWADESKSIAKALFELPADEGLATVTEIYARIQDERKRRLLITTFRGPPPHEHFLEIAHLGVIDREPRITGFALGLIERLGMTRFTDDRTTYEAWRAAQQGQSIHTVIAEGARTYAARLQNKRGDELLQALGDVHPNMYLAAQAGDPGERRRILREAGVLAILESAMADSNASMRLKLRAQWWADAIGADEAWVQEHAQLIADDPSAYAADVAVRAYGVLGKDGSAEAVRCLVAAFERTPRKSDWMSIAMALAATKRAEAIPAMIGMIEADGSSRASTYGIGWFGLGRLTGVSWDASHDAAWWRKWWAENRHRYAGEGGNQDIPRLGIEAK